MRLNNFCFKVLLVSLLSSSSFALENEDDVTYTQSV